MLVLKNKDSCFYFVFISVLIRLIRKAYKALLSYAYNDNVCLISHERIFLYLNTIFPVRDLGPLYDGDVFLP